MSRPELVVDAPEEASGTEADLAPTTLDGRAAATVALLAADMVEEAKSGHGGLPMGMALPVWVLFARHLRHDPGEPSWPDRDRFVLSAGHGSALLYALLHLFGYELSLDDLRRFRQLGSATPGHPEHGHTPGVETTTGPLGQGIANAVGMALAERMLAARLNRSGHCVVDHRTFVVASDGDLMEGVSHEAASLAGHLGLGKLVVLYDANGVTIDGPASDACSDDVAARFAGYGWQVLTVPDPRDPDGIDRLLTYAISEPDRPSLVVVPSVIGLGVPGTEGTPAAHGGALGARRLAATKRRYGWPAGETFVVPDEVAKHAGELARLGAERRQVWEQARRAWAASYPGLAAWWERSLGRDLAEMSLPSFAVGASMATRRAFGEALAAAAESLPELVGGSADLAGSTGTAAVRGGNVDRDHFDGRIIHYGIREHAMAAVSNGLALHGEWRPYASTFLVFSDYLRPSLRLSALMGLPVLYAFSHDSIAVGEDGPTHQPVEHVESLRLVPNLAVLRPADANETAACVALALARTSGPTALVLTRQDVPVLDLAEPSFLGEEGARVVEDGGEQPDVVLVASGSEVSLALQAAGRLATDEVRARVVSVPWRERWEASGGPDNPRFRPLNVPAVFVEAGVPSGWQRLSRPGDAAVGLQEFGTSGPAADVCAALGLDVEAVVDTARQVVFERRGVRGEQTAEPGQKVGP